MGFHVSTLHNLPVGKIRYFIYVVDASVQGAHSDWINADLTNFGATLGPDVGLVTGPRDLSHELYRFLQDSLEPSDFCALEALLHSTTCLLLSEGNLQTARGPVHLVPVADRKATKDQRAFVQALIQKVATGLAARRTLQEVVSQFGAHEFRLMTRDAGLFVCTLRWINNTIELKPNLAGIGINLNALIERFLVRAGRQVHSSEARQMSENELERGT